MRHILITGAAGFIGSHTAERLLAQGDFVTGIDNFDSSQTYKLDNLSRIRDHGNFRFIGADIRAPGAFSNLKEAPDVVVHLAGQAGVRSAATPSEYYDVNVRGTHAVLEMIRIRRVAHLVFASSSSIYGANPNTPWRESDSDLRPISHYAATKLCAEALCRIYSQLHSFSAVALRLFTVYGPRQRPDLAIHKLAVRMMMGRPIEVYGDGGSARDYTYIGDALNAINSATGLRGSRFEVVNVGSGRPVPLKEMIQSLERALGVSAAIVYGPPHPSDVPVTHADLQHAGRVLGYRPTWKFETGPADIHRMASRTSKPGGVNRGA